MEDFVLQSWHTYHELTMEFLALVSGHYLDGEDEEAAVVTFFLRNRWASTTLKKLNKIYNFHVYDDGLMKTPDNFDCNSTWRKITSHELFEDDSAFNLFKRGNILLWHIPTKEPLNSKPTTRKLNFGDLTKEPPTKMARAKKTPQGSDGRTVHARTKP